MKYITFQDGMVGNAIITNTNPVTVLTGIYVCPRPLQWKHSIFLSNWGGAGFLLSFLESTKSVNVLTFALKTSISDCMEAETEAEGFSCFYYNFC
jgi:hypothetical protein